MNIELNYEETINILNLLGKEKFFNFFSNLYPNFKLYTMSLDWIDSNNYILKFKGELGDLIVKWL